MLNILEFTTKSHIRANPILTNKMGFVLYSVDLADGESDLICFDILSVYKALQPVSVHLTAGVLDMHSDTWEGAHTAIRLKVTYV